MTLSSTTTGLPEPEAPDTLDEEEMMLSLESKAMDVDMVIRAMQRENGVSKSMIAPVQHLLPPHLKLNSFSKNPTMTNYSVSMESMSAATAVLIGGAVAAFAALVAKLIFWLVGMFKANDKASAAAEKSAVQMTASLKSTKELEKFVSPAIRRDYEERKAERLKPIYDEMAQLYNGVLRDILVVGPITRCLAAADSTFTDIVKKMKLMLELVRTESKKDNSGDELAVNRVLTTMNDIEIHSNDPTIRTAFTVIHRATSNPVDYQEDMREIIDSLNSTIAQAYSSSFRGDQVVAQLEGYSVDKCPLRKVKQPGQLEGLLTEVNKLEKSSFNPKVGADVDRALRSCLSSMRKMIDVVQKYDAMIAKCERMRNHFVELSKRAANTENTAMIAAIAASDDEDAKKKLREMNKSKK
ncbi:hypothetical protein D3C78_950300 [compost metagenome]